MCAYCNKPKRLTLARAVRSKRHFCDSKCQALWLSENTRGTNNPQFSSIEVQCGECGTKKFVHPSRAKRNKHFFCDQKCFRSWLSKGNYQRKSTKIKVACSNCKKPKMVTPYALKRNKHFFCNKTCWLLWFQKNSRKKEKSSSWKGGVKKRQLCAYDTYAKQIKFMEDVRRKPTETNILQVKCAYCGIWFTPTQNAVRNRIRVTHLVNHGESRLYCSDECKNECPTFNQRKFLRGREKYSAREVQPELRQMVFERDGWECQICGDNKSLHCHHLEGIKQNPIESVDIDICITVCNTCHEYIHSQYGCRRFDLRCVNG